MPGARAVSEHPRGDGARREIARLAGRTQALWTQRRVSGKQFDVTSDFFPTVRGLCQPSHSASLNAARASFDAILHQTVSAG